MAAGRFVRCSTCIISLGTRCNLCGGAKSSRIMQNLNSSFFAGKAFTLLRSNARCRRPVSCSVYTSARSRLRRLYILIGMFPRTCRRPIGVLRSFRRTSMLMRRWTRWPPCCFGGDCNPSFTPKSAGRHMCCSATPSPEPLRWSGAVWGWISPRFVMKSTIGRLN